MEAGAIKPKGADLDPEFLKPSASVTRWRHSSTKAITNKRKDDQRAALLPPSAEVQEYDVEIPVRDGTKIAGRIFAPSKPNNGGSPLFVFFHDGGYCIGSRRDEMSTNRELAARLGLIVLSVEYRLAPEHAFPTCVYDALDAVKWCSANATALKANPKSGLLVGGVSSGGNIAQAVVYLNRDDHDSPVNITGQFLSVANLLPPPVVPLKFQKDYLSMEENKEVSIPPPEVVKMFMEAFKPDLSSPLFVPFNHPKGHSGIPPTYFQVCGADPLRDEELIYERVLREECSIPTRLDIYPGLPHHFWEIFPQLTDHVAHREADTVRGCQWLLEQGKLRIA